MAKANHIIALDGVAPKNSDRAIIIPLNNRFAQDSTDVDNNNYNDEELIPKAAVMAMIAAAVADIQAGVAPTKEQFIGAGGSTNTFSMSYTGDLSDVYIWAESNGQPYTIFYDKIAKTITRSGPEAITVFYKP